MGFKNVIILGTLLVGSLALPTPFEEPTKEVYAFPQRFHGMDPAECIIGGDTAPEGSAPHMVAITISRQVRSFYCGGSLISPRTILTAAHCNEGLYAQGIMLSSVRATVGTNRWASGGVTYTIARNITHKDFNFDALINDIGLLITNEEVQFSKVIKPITISYDWVGGNIPVRANGWGYTTWGGKHSPVCSPVLLELSMSSVDGEKCVTEVAEVAKSLGITDAIPVKPDIQICTFKAVEHGMCHGDSGSGLIQVSNGQLVGIVSWGIPCAVGAPDIFTRVSVYKQWILSHTV